MISRRSARRRRPSTGTAPDRTRPGDLAAIAGVTVEDLRRVLDDLVADGVVSPHPTDEPARGRAPRPGEFIPAAAAG